jgi:uncharacterized membrane protein
LKDSDKKKIVDEYLRDLSGELTDVSPAIRRELLEDVKAHIEEAWANTPEKTSIALRNILEQLGDPANLAREERERLGLPNNQSQQTDFLAIAGVVFTVLFWPVGLLLAWLSPSWRTRDKIIATVIPIAGLLLLIAVQVVAVMAFQTNGVVTESHSTNTTGISQGLQVAPSVVVRIASLLAVGLGLFGAPLISAAFLTWQLKNGRRVMLVPIVAVGLLGAALFVFVAFGLFSYSSFVTTRTTGQPATVQIEPLPQNQ